MFFIGQVKIDSTGKAQGVLRRIQVRYSPEANPADNPVSAVMGDNKICKRFAVGPSSYQDMASQCVAESEDADPTAEVKGGGDGGPGESKPDAVIWRRQFTNTSVNDPSLVESCTWDWGDGSAPEGGACLNGEIKKHEFIHPYRGNKCYAATVTLTIKLTNGKQKIATTTQKVAYGGGAADYCGNRWPAL